MANKKFSLVPRILRRVMFSLVPCILLATLSGVQCADVFFSEDSDETVYYCPTDLDTYRVDLTYTYSIFGTNINHVYFNTPGYLTDTFRPNLGAPVKFPKYSGSNYTKDCDGVHCWVHYYYTDTQVQEIEDQNYSEECVHGRPFTSLFNVHATLVYEEFDSYDRIFEPDGCISADADETIEDYSWMLAGYWQNLDSQHLNSTMWYRETQDGSILSEAQAAVLALDFVSDFTPTSCVIFAWDRVTYIDGFAYGYPQISFQITLVTDGTDTYVIYNYNELAFPGGQAGFDAGDTYNYCGLHESRSNMSNTWTHTSNVDIPGRWVMKLGEGYDRTICEPLRADVPYCLCDDGWEGRICASSVDDCIGHNCPAEAACVDGHLSYTCNFCAGVTCHNDGSCVNNENTQSYQCNCVGSHTGDHCEQCLELTCDNGGVCTNDPSTGENTCACAEGYSGTTCQNDLCTGVTCENDGVCVMDTSTQSYQCECVEGYTGVHCEQCVDLSCQNGGVCTNNAASGQSTCTCAQGYSGSECQTSNADFLNNPEESSEDSGLSTAEIIGIVLGATAALVILLVLLILIIRHNKKKDEVEPLQPQSGRNTSMASHA